MSYIFSHSIPAVLEFRSNWPISVSFSLSDDQISRMGSFSAKRSLSCGGIATALMIKRPKAFWNTISLFSTYAESTQIIGALAYKLNIHISFFVHLVHISCFGIYPKSEVVIIKQNTLHFCFFLDWALGGAALGLTVALVEFIANSVVEVPTNDYHTIMNILVLTIWKWCGLLERFLISLLMTLLGSECGEQAEGLSRPDGLFETNTCLFDVE